MRALSFLLLASCTHDLAVFDGIDDVQTARDLDILFVIDTSADHARYDQMASQVDILENRLAEVDGQVPNLRIGVVTADLGVRGTADATAAPNVRNCGGIGDGAKLTTFFTPLDGRFIEDSRGPDGTRIRNFDQPDLETQLALVTNPGSGKVGCEVAQPLEAMRLALDPATNPGFIRDKAMLSVVFLTNDDDCSLKSGTLLDPRINPNGVQPFRCTSEGVVCSDEITSPGTHTNCRPRETSDLVAGVAEYTTFLSEYKPNGVADIAVSAVIGAPTPVTVLSLGQPTLIPSCRGGSGEAKPAVRLANFVASLGGSIVDSCTQENAYDQIATPIVLKQKSCFPALRAADGDNCRVIEVIGAEQTELESCDEGGSPPCWRKYTDEVACPGGENIGIQIDRGMTTVPAASRIEARCFVAD
jgi:hypothetical protein